MNTSIACQPAPSSYFKSHDIINDEMASDVIEHDHTLVSHHPEAIKFLFNPMISFHCQENNVQWEDFMFSSIRQISSLEVADMTLQANTPGFINKHSECQNS